MNNDFENIIKKFEELNRKGYIQGINNNLYNAAGLTLEHYLGKKADSMFFPDYNGIEIKCTQRFSRYDVTLFSLSFDGPSLFESNYLLETYGIQDTIYKDYKKLTISLKLNKKVSINNKYYFELKIDNEKIYIKIYNSEQVPIENRGYIYLDSIKKRFLIKLNKLALIYASKKKINNDLYFRYYKIECFKYQGIDSFIKCLEQETIKVSLILRFSRNKDTFGKNKNKNFVFTISKNELDLLFDKVYYEKN